jgi:hypothetical protein
MFGWTPGDLHIKKGMQENFFGSLQSAIAVSIVGIRVGA